MFITIHSVRLTGISLLLLGIGMTNTLLAAEPTGASVIWTSDDPAIAAARKEINSGQLREAEQMLSQLPENPAAREGLDVIRRIRLQFSLDEAGLLVQLRQSIPSVNSDQLARWRASDDLDFRVLDGKICYFTRTAGNLFRRNKEAQQMQGIGPSDGKQPGWQLTDHLADVIAAAKTSDSPSVSPLRHHVKYSLTVDLPDWVHPGSFAQIWLPYPQEDRQQTQLQMISTSIPPLLISPPGTPQRTVYFEVTVKDAKQPIKISEEFEFVCSAWYPKLNDEKAKPLKTDWGDRDLAERLPHIAFTDAMRQRVSQIIGNETNPLKKARLIFYWISQNIPWSAEQEYCIVPSFSTKGLSAMTGDCGIQGTLFITMCRVAGVPARWQSGWQLRPNDAGMHDWAEFYCDPWGWLPADASYGLKESSDPAVREFYFGHQDSYRMTVNTDYGQPLVPPKESLRSEPADFQRGEVQIDGHNLYFDQWDYDFSVSTAPAQ